MKKIATCLARGAGLWMWAMAATSAIAATEPADKFDYVREASFAYDELGRLKTSTQEPGNGQCSKTTQTYAATGQVLTTTRQNCTGATGDAVFATRTVSSTTVAAGSVTIATSGGNKTVAVPAGAWIATVTTSIGTSKVDSVDPRFGEALKATAVNDVVTRQELDDFGRVTRQVLGDETQVITRYCILSGASRNQSSNSDGCVVPAETPPDAVAYVETQKLSRQGNAMGPWQRAFTDGLGRTLRNSTQAFDGPQQPDGFAKAVIVQDAVYDQYGAKTSVTQPYFFGAGGSDFESASKGTTGYTYNALGQILEVREANTQGRRASGFAVTSFVYEGLITRTTNDALQEKVEERNGLGQLVRVTDPAGAQLSYRYDAFGHPETIRDAFDNRHVFTRTTLGWVTQVKDPDKGTESYSYDAAGQVRSKLGPLQTVATRYDYDAEGRLIQRVDPEYQSTWAFDGCTNGKGQLCSSTTTSGVSRVNQYDSLGRVTSQKTSITAGPVFAWGLSYDADTGRLSKTVYPSGLVTRNEYTSELGYPLQVTLQTAVTVGSSTVQAGTALWKAVAQDARGIVSVSQLGGVTTTQVALDPLTSKITAIQAGTAAAVLNMGFGWDSIGNLTTRVDHIGAGRGAVTETFGYGNDANSARNINRLTSYTVSSPGITDLTRTVELRYNALGMMLFKSDVGAYAYGPQGPAATRPHAPVKVAGINFQHDTAGNVKQADGGKYRALSFTSFNRPAGNQGVQGETETYEWLYDDDYQRIKERRIVSSGANAGTRTQWYLNPDDIGGLGFEREELQLGSSPAVNSNRHYIQAFGLSVGAIVSTDALPVLGASDSPAELATMVAAKVEFWHKDHLGSLLATSDQTGAVKARYSYDPFGKRRDPGGEYDQANAIEITWGAGAAIGTARGFTGHEHLDDVGLVNMNGRLFDARLGVFVQADPTRGAPDDLQNFAAYAYVRNNPLNATDPSGFKEGDEKRDTPANEVFKHAGNARTIGGIDNALRGYGIPPEAVDEIRIRGGGYVIYSYDEPSSQGTPSAGPEQLRTLRMKTITFESAGFSAQFSRYLNNRAEVERRLVSRAEKGAVRSVSETLREVSAIQEQSSVGRFFREWLAAAGQPTPDLDGLADQIDVASKLRRGEKLDAEDGQVLLKAGVFLLAGRTAAKGKANFSRELKAVDMGLQGTVKELRGTFALKDGVATMRVDMIRGDIANPLQVVGNMTEAAKASGATSLRIEGTIANERLYNVLERRYGLTSSGATDVITIPLK